MEETGLKFRFFVKILLVIGEKLPKFAFRLLYFMGMIGSIYFLIKVQHYMRIDALF